MKNRRSRRSVDSRPRVSPPIPEPTVHAMPERYVKWRNETGRLVTGSFGSVKVNDWTPGLTRSLPEQCGEDAEAAGLTHMGYVQ
jgi:hypothetical protein